MAYLTILRIPNLIIVGITQYLLMYLVIKPIFEPEIPLVLNPILFLLFVIDTIIIAASGYVINDILDYKTDQINKPHRAFIPTKISVLNAKIYYASLILIGQWVAIFIAWQINHLTLAFIYPVAILLLYIYSKYLKSTVIWGNVFVSLFVSFVAGIVLFAERDGFLALKNINFEKYNLILQLFISYLTFAFFSNFIREIVKDCEDIEGDKIQNIKTIATSWGIQKTKSLAMVLTVFFFIGISIWSLYSGITQDFRLKMFILLFISAPLLMVLQRLNLAQTSSDFQKISTFLKYIMLSGLVSIIFISQNSL